MRFINMQTAKLLLNNKKVDPFPFAFKYPELKPLIIQRVKDPLGGFILGSKFINYESADEFPGEAPQFIEANYVKEYEIRIKKTMESPSIENEDVDISSDIDDDHYLKYAPKMALGEFSVRGRISKVEEFCHKFAVHLMVIRTSLKEQIQWLTKLIDNYPEFKQSIHYAALSVIESNNIVPVTLNKELKSLCGAFRGFLLLSFKPKYTFMEILDILKNEGYTIKSINTALGFIGAYMGLNELMSQDITPSLFIEQEIYDELNGNLNIFMK
jgi:hypothetical protein